MPQGVQGNLTLSCTLLQNYYCTFLNYIQILKVPVRTYLKCINALAAFLEYNSAQSVQ